MGCRGCHKRVVVVIVRTRVLGHQSEVGLLELVLGGHVAVRLPAVGAPPLVRSLWVGQSQGLGRIKVISNCQGKFSSSRWYFSHLLWSSLLIWGYPREFLLEGISLSVVEY
ncbi:hypothetical protein SRHO_G00281120 [Serrasalmus rhombeus]